MAQIGTIADAYSVDLGTRTTGINSYKKEALKSLVKDDDSSGRSDFFELLKQSVETVNENQEIADKMAVDVATGKSEQIHETMLAVTQAELGFNLMVQVRNKALEAYQEVMRIPV